ncbi:MAG: DUF3179 domain-containing protein [Planctomycetota bacterium]
MKKPRKQVVWFALISLILIGAFRLYQTRNRPQAAAAEPVVDEQEALERAFKAEANDFSALLSDDASEIGYALMRINGRWHDASPVMLLEVFRFAPNAATARGGLELMRRRLEIDKGTKADDWFEYLWTLPEPTYRGYAQFKADLYGGLVDERFSAYFSPDAKKTIRLDEIRWGGVKQDGIPPLDNPEMLSADEAVYLADSDVVFGVTQDGRAKAYPKRILAWHEMVKDTIGEDHITGVYCTLCGAMIVYNSTTNDDIQHDFGTSGFLYRSNKLMYDKATNSLWSSIRGKPVVGPFAGTGMELETLPVVTTTWGEWKKRHPRTLVLDIETGYDRDYGEGVAYRDYFASKDLMFSVPKRDDRLENKDEVFIVRVDGKQLEVAFPVDFLAKNTVFHDQEAGTRFVILTDSSGASRAYETPDVTFVETTPEGTVVDDRGKVWSLGEDALVSLDSKEELKRLAAHRVFWFAWFSQHPETRLVK